MTYFLGALALAIGSFSIISNIIFYSSLGTGIYSYTLGFMALCADLLKYAAVKSFNAALGQPDRAVEISSAVIFWVVFTILSLIAGYSFISTAYHQYEDTQMRQSNVYNSSNLSFQNARRKVESLAQFADTASAEAAKEEKARLNSELNQYLQLPAKNGQGTPWGTIGGRTGDCTKTYSYYVKSYCPKIKALQADIEKQDDFVRGHRRFISANSYLEQTSVALSKLSSTGGNAHPGFKNLGGILNIDPETLKGWVTAIMTLFLELATSWLIHMRMRVYQSPTQFRNAQLTNYTHTGYKPPRQVFVQNSSVGSLMPRLPFFGNWSANSDDHLIKQARKALMLGLIKPSGYGLRMWADENGKVLKDSAIKAFQSKWIEEGLIEACKSRNGSNTYRLREQ